jgi:predicted SprT family Zn-dependent metalloprotease
MALKVNPDIREVMDYMDIQTWIKYDKLCEEGILDRDIIEPPVVKFSRAMENVYGTCQRRITFHEYDGAKDVIYIQTAVITYNLVHIEQNLYKPEFWEKLDETISHEVSHLVMEHFRYYTLNAIDKAFRGHGPKWKEAMQFLGIASPRVTVNNPDFAKDMMAFAYKCPTCKQEQYVYKKPPKDKVYVCPICKEMGVRSYISRELVHRVR